MISEYFKFVHEAFVKITHEEDRKITETMDESKRTVL